MNLMEEKKTESFNKKLEKSYKQCFAELCNPVEDWENTLVEQQYCINSKTGLPNTSHRFFLTKDDDITIGDFPDCDYVFKRSHFYKTFAKRKSRLKKDLIEYWNGKGYTVKLFPSTHPKYKDSWILSLRW